MGGWVKEQIQSECRYVVNDIKNPIENFSTRHPEDPLRCE